MGFAEKYCSNSDKDKPENKAKKVISDDAFAISELLEAVRIELWRGARK